MHQNIKSSLGLLIAALMLSGVPQANAVAADTDKQTSALKVRQQLSAAFMAAEKVSWIAEGRGTRIMYIFFDPNCPYCKKLYEELRPRVGHNGLQVRWIPVGILLPTSFGKAAAILEAKDPLLALRQNEEGFSTATGFGAANETFASAKTTTALKQNADLLKQAGGQSVPTLLYRDKTGQIKTRQGAPSPKILDALLAQVK